MSRGWEVSFEILGRLSGIGSLASTDVLRLELASDPQLGLKLARFTSGTAKGAETVRRLQELERVRALRAESESDSTTVRPE